MRIKPYGSENERYVTCSYRHGDLPGHRCRHRAHVDETRFGPHVPLKHAMSNHFSASNSPCSTMFQPFSAKFQLLFLVFPIGLQAPKPFVSVERQCDPRLSLQARRLQQDAAVRAQFALLWMSRTILFSHGNSTDIGIMFPHLRPF